ncbi:hypothetical protein HPB52_015129 [Rhipicephalus sanguineus]|uniref:Uncharacterized protein n=1 Tax=Rhipicephalus sanguineus TaxID=34632 RepID=A0A9D4Q0I1_RHISA|nr:hypothetical protein HPB52_015129 [Rhipicephalus sanguineus]
MCHPEATGELPEGGEIRFLDLKIAFGAEHTCWEYSPRSKKDLLPFSSHHSKLKKAGFSDQFLSGLAEALLKEHRKTASNAPLGVGRGGLYASIRLEARGVKTTLIFSPMSPRYVDDTANDRECYQWNAVSCRVRATPTNPANACRLPLRRF